jgi:hypothetical protein
LSTGRSLKHINKDARPPKAGILLSSVGVTFLLMQALTSHPGRAVDLSRYRNPDKDPRGSYLLTSITVPLQRPMLQYEWRGALPPKGRSWRFSREHAQQLEAEGRIVFSTSGQPRLKRYLDEPATAEAPVPTGRSKLEIAVRSCMSTIARLIAESPGCLPHVEWRDLERALRAAFEGLGFQTRLTRAGKDGGFDLELKYTEDGIPQTALIEVKHWAGSGKRPGRKVYRSLLDVVARSGPQVKGLLLSSTGFTCDVVHGCTEIELQKVRLGDQAKIVSVCQSYVQSLDGIWMPTTDKAELLWPGTR